MKLMSVAVGCVKRLRALVWQARSTGVASTAAAVVPLAPHLLLGQQGEERALHLLERHGYRLVATNVRLPVGRSRRNALVLAEIDIIAYDGATLCFVEVKTRRSDSFAAPEANVDLRKQRQISRAARVYRRMLGLTNDAHRYDVVSVILPSPDTGGTLPPARLELFRAFWTDAKFRKRRWSDGRLAH